MCAVCERFGREVAAGRVGGSQGAIAQLAEHLDGIEGVPGSNPGSSTTTNPLAAVVSSVGYTLGGFVAGEGCFCTSLQRRFYADGSPRFRFVFTVRMAQRDRPLLVALQSFLGVGSIVDALARRSHWLPQSTYTVTSLRAHHAAIIPFAEQFLLPCAKRTQFQRWREQMAAQEAAHPNRWGLGPADCTRSGCMRPVRGRGLCRVHYYEVTGY